MFDTFNKHAVSSIKTRVFEKEIFNNEIIWTYIIAKLALKNDDIYKKITTFNKHELHSIYLESQPIVPYIGDEGNSYLDMALGSLGIRTETQSGIEFNQGHGKDVCFLEAKYLSDISVKTTHNPVRNQMDRVIENLLCFQGKDSEQNVIYPDNIVFTLLTPKIFKETVGTRLYYYKFHEYKKINSNNNLDLIKNIQIENGRIRTKNWAYPQNIDERIDMLTLNWITFEEIFEMEYPQFAGKDLTKLDDAYAIWNKVISDLSFT